MVTENRTLRETCSGPGVDPYQCSPTFSSYENKEKLAKKIKGSVRLKENQDNKMSSEETKRKK